MTLSEKKKKKRTRKILQLRSGAKSNRNNTVNHQKIKQVLVAATEKERKYETFDQERLQIL
jgi:hypothetical protein